MISSRKQSTRASRRRRSVRLGGFFGDGAGPDALPAGFKCARRPALEQVMRPRRRSWTSDPSGQGRVHRPTDHVPGHTNTHDNVIRRELRVPGSGGSTAALKDSVLRLNQLGFQRSRAAGINERSMPPGRTRSTIHPQVREQNRNLLVRGGRLPVRGFSDSSRSRPPTSSAQRDRLRVAAARSSRRVIPDLVQRSVSLRSSDHHRGVSRGVHLSSQYTATTGPTSFRRAARHYTRCSGIRLPAVPSSTSRLLTSRRQRQLESVPARRLLLDQGGDVRSSRSPRASSSIPSPSQSSHTGKRLTASFALARPGATRLSTRPPRSDCTSALAPAVVACAQKKPIRPAFCQTEILPIREVLPGRR